MTEEEARAKWCPFVRSERQMEGHVGVEGGWSVNRDTKGRPVSRCIASDCMAWRNRPAIYDTEVSYDQAMPSGGGWERTSDLQYVVSGSGVWSRRVENSAATGYCGLAGAPR